jgi:hypothetical protein
MQEANCTFGIVALTAYGFINVNNTLCVLQHQLTAVVLLLMCPGGSGSEDEGLPASYMQYKQQQKQQAQQAAAASSSSGALCQSDPTAAPAAGGAEIAGASSKQAALFGGSGPSSGAGTRRWSLSSDDHPHEDTPAAAAVGGQGHSTARHPGIQSAAASGAQQGDDVRSASQQHWQQPDQPTTSREVADETLQRYSQDGPATVAGSSSRQISGTQVSGGHQPAGS